MAPSRLDSRVSFALSNLGWMTAIGENFRGLESEVGKKAGVGVQPKKTGSQPTFREIYHVIASGHGLTNWLGWDQRAGRWQVGRVLVETSSRMRLSRLENVEKARRLPMRD